MGHKDISDIARYEQIAVDLATKIAHKDYEVGAKLYGRSVLAGQYNVSPETIRRAVALLQGMGIVEVVAGRGISVVNRQAAVNYIENFNHRKGLLQAQSDFADLLEKRRLLDEQIDHQIKKILSFTSRMVNILPRVEEINITEDCILANQSLRDSQFRSRTDATVLAVERNGEEFLSPDSEMTLLPGDILVYVGGEGCKEKVEAFIGMNK